LPAADTSLFPELPENSRLQKNSAVS
jgi:hypothetical protein